MAGYSKTSLSQKLGLKAGFKVFVLHEPANYWDWLAPLPDITIVQKPVKEMVDFAMFLFNRRKILKKHLQGLSRC
jgi:hypothetical protein